MHRVTWKRYHFFFFNLQIDSTSSTLWRLVTWIQISASLNHRKLRNKQSPVGGFLGSLQQTSSFYLSQHKLTLSTLLQHN